MATVGLAAFRDVETAQVVCLDAGDASAASDDERPAIAPAPSSRSGFGGQCTEQCSRKGSCFHLKCNLPKIAHSPHDYMIIVVAAYLRAMAYLHSSSDCSSSFVLALTLIQPD
jgi:hypothetical protein